MSLPRKKFRGQQGRCIVYGLFDSDGNLRYVGKSSNGMYRPKEHLRKNSYNGVAKNTYLYKWVRSVIHNGSEPIIKVLVESTRETLAQDEIAEIKKARQAGCKLTNATDGGEGCLGRIISESHREKLRIVHTGKIVSDETRRRLSESHMGIPSGKKGKSLSKELKQKISDGSTLKKQVICIETSRIYESVATAIKDIGCSKNYFLKHINKKTIKRKYKLKSGKVKTCDTFCSHVKGFTYRYLKETICHLPA